MDLLHFKGQKTLLSDLTFVFKKIFHRLMNRFTLKQDVQWSNYLLTKTILRIFFNIQYKPFNI